MIQERLENLPRTPRLESKFIKVIGGKEKNMVKEFTNGEMVESTEDSGRMDNVMATE